MKPHPCKHLDYAGEYIDCTIKTLEPHYPEVRYWERGERWTEGGNPRDVQFCALRGRINSKLACYLAELGCYEAAMGAGEDE